MNIKFVVRGLLLVLPVAVIAPVVLLLWLRAQAQIGPPPDPTPPPPTILAPRHELPARPVGLQEWAQYKNEPSYLRGSGFLFRLGNGDVVGVTAAHSLSLGEPQYSLERMALKVAGQTESVAEFEALHGPPGQPRTGDDLTVDYVLLQPSQPAPADFVLQPDPRGAPQPGERVSLFSGLGDGRGGRRILAGTVQSVSDRAVWVLMDELFEAGMMSGSPFVSQHTGQVVGMLIAGTPRRGRLFLGAHPIGSLVHLAETATEFPKLNVYRR